jgi:streptomycin 6-kinase
MARVTLPIPANLAAAAARPELAELRDWVAALPDAVRLLTDQWSLRVGSPFEPGGQCSWVAPVVNADDRRLVLKVGWSHPEAEDEEEALRLWNGHGAVLVHACTRFDRTQALLLERCVPGTRLKAALPEEEQDLVVAGLLRRLWREPPNGHPFRPLQQMCDLWADEFEHKLARSPQPPDAGLAREGIQMWRTLPGLADRNVVLVTDLHGENILAAQREPWLVIDPKPYVGDPAYDVLQHMLNCPQRLRADPVGLARRLAQLLELNDNRVLRWLFARCVQESLDEPDLAQVARRIARLNPCGAVIR